MSEEGFDRIEQRLGQVDSKLEDLGRNMRVLYEDLKDDIRALRPEGPTRDEVRRWDDDVRESVGQRLDPLEAAVRRHSADIERLEQQRG